MARRKVGFWYRLAVVLLKPFMLLFTRRDWTGLTTLPPGGLVVVTNHMSHADPIVVAHFLWEARRPPRFLAKDSVFDVFFVGRLVRGAQQIPVYRETRDAAASVRAAVEAVRAGECVVVYPEGTITRDPDLWPMRGKTGAARIALTTGCAVVPLAHWGAQDLLAPYSRRLRLLPRKVMHVAAGPPVDLDDLQGGELTAEVLHEATERIMDALTALVAELRGEQPPAQRFDPRAAGLPTIGDPHRAARREGTA